jgi:N-acetylglucosaminyldiphosphoundecaprenol N-acetyl-beta-D-mannosaminyltransferase
LPSVGTGGTNGDLALLLFLCQILPSVPNALDSDLAAICRAFENETPDPQDPPLSTPLPDAFALMASVLTGWFILVYWRRRRDGRRIEWGAFAPLAFVRARPRLNIKAHAVRGERADPQDGLAREVYCVLGIPIDAVTMVGALRHIKRAATSQIPYLVSTANLNFLISSRRDAEFRESLLRSDLCVADGMAVVWIARFLGIPLQERVTGADMFAALKTESSDEPMRVCLFGGNQGIAATAAAKLNAQPGGLTCVGAIDPGIGTVEDLSHSALLNEINASEAQLLAISLGAKKGQSWLLRNHDLLRVPVRLHFGAAINFEAGAVRRAPQFMRRAGLEWLWRIKEEPYLWARYAHDGIALLTLLLTRIAPLALSHLRHRLVDRLREDGLNISHSQELDKVVLRLSGEATARTVAEARRSFERALRAGNSVALDCSELNVVDARFLGMLMEFHRQLRNRALHLHLFNAPRRVATALRQNGLSALLSADRPSGIEAEARLPVDLDAPELLAGASLPR